MKSFNELQGCWGRNDISGSKFFYCLFLFIWLFIVWLIFLNSFVSNFFIFNQSFRLENASNQKYDNFNKQFSLVFLSNSVSNLIHFQDKMALLLFSKRRHLKPKVLICKYFEFGSYGLIFDKIIPKLISKQLIFPINFYKK